jgi:hypothetical protein
VESGAQTTDAWVEHCRVIGAKGGASTSEAKRLAARANARQPRPAARQRNAERRAEKESAKKELKSVEPGADCMGSRKSAAP